MKNQQSGKGRKHKTQASGRGGRSTREGTGHFVKENTEKRRKIRGRVRWAKSRRWNAKGNNHVGLWSGGTNPPGGEDTEENKRAIDNREGVFKGNQTGARDPSII